jgi:hypothetical protein
MANSPRLSYSSFNSNDFNCRIGKIMAAKKMVWDKPNPKSKSKKLSPKAKANAKAMAKAAGRPYPNLIDNMRAAKKKKK